jgi:hypothetical protein
MRLVCLPRHPAVAYVFLVRSMRTSIASFARIIDDYAKVLEPFIRSARRGSLSWNGSEYAQVTEDVDPDPYALAWWSTLGAISALLASQSSLTSEQYSYLQHEFFGTMGSLQDFCLDAKRWGEKASVANEELRKILDELYSAFQSLRPVEQTKT